MTKGFKSIISRVDTSMVGRSITICGISDGGIHHSAIGLTVFIETVNMSGEGRGIITHNPNSWVHDTVRHNFDSRFDLVHDESQNSKIYLDTTI